MNFSSVHNEKELFVVERAFDRKMLRFESIEGGTIGRIVALHPPLRARRSATMCEI